MWKISATGPAVLVDDIYPGSVTYPDGRVYGYGSNPELFAVRNGKLYFKANAPTVGIELFETTGSGATLFQDIVPGP